MVTMQDIADQTKVSRRTVSCVLSGKYKKARISEATKDKILISTEKLGYKRNALATATRTGKTNVIGVIGTLCSSYSMDIIKGINSSISGNNYMIKLFPTDTEEEVENAARQCVEQWVAGVICRSLSEEGLNVMRKELEPNNIPIVLVDSSFSHDWCPRVISDDFEGAKKATEYLMNIGHSRIGHITNSLNRGFAKLRCDGYLEIMKTIDGFDAVDSICEINNPADLDYKILSSFLDKVANYLKSFKPTALFCSTDIIAMKVMVIVSRLDLKIPDDISIVGYGGLNVSLLANPALTTVQQNFTQMGEKAAEILYEEINGYGGGKQIKLPVELVIRDSAKQKEAI